MSHDRIEFRFKAASSSNQVLLAKDGDFAVRLIDEGSATDNKGKTALDWARSGGFHDVAASLEKAILKVIEKKRNKRYNQKHFEYLRRFWIFPKKCCFQIWLIRVQRDAKVILIYSN